MIIEPKIRGFICTTAHPAAAPPMCSARSTTSWSRADPARAQARAGARLLDRLRPRLAHRHRVRQRADTVGVSFEKPPAESKTASAGWYNNRAFETARQAAGRKAMTIDGDAFSDAIKAEAVEAIQANLGQVDLIVYSLASPVRTDPKDGVTYRSAIKPYGGAGHRPRPSIPAPARSPKSRSSPRPRKRPPPPSRSWAARIGSCGSRRCRGRRAGRRLPSLNYTYLGSELTWPIYHNGTLGRAKADLDRAAAAIRAKLGEQAAHVVALKAVVTQASSAIPVVPLYGTLLFKVDGRDGPGRRLHRADRPPVPRQAAGRQPAARRRRPHPRRRLGNVRDDAGRDHEPLGRRSPPRLCPTSPTCRDTARNSSSSSASASAGSTTRQDVDPQVVN